MNKEKRKSISGPSSENWIIEDCHLATFSKELEINEFKSFSRKNQFKDLRNVNQSIQKEEKQESKLEIEEKIKDFSPLTNFENNIVNSRYKKSSFFLKSPKISKSENKLNKSDFEAKDSMTKSKFFKVMVKYFLVRKFIRILRENTYYRRPNCLTNLHQNLINDLIYFKRGTKNIEELTKITDIFPKLQNKIIKRTLEMFLNAEILIRVKKKLSFVIHPTNKFIIAWEIFLTFLNIFYFILVPIQIAFNGDIFCSMNNNSSYSNFFFIMFLIDIFLNFNMAYYKKGELVVSKTKIFRSYLQGRFMKDLLSISFLIFTGFLKFSPKFLLVRITGFLFLLRIQNIARSISRLEDYIFTDENTANLFSFIRLIINIYLFSHWSACIWKLIGSIDEKDGWVSHYNLDYESEFNKYIFSLYYIVVVMNTVGFGDVVAQTINEKIFTICFIYVACVIFAYTINSVGTILQNINKNEVQFKRIRNLINGYMKMKNIDFRLKIKIRNYLEYVWQYAKIQNISESNEAIQQLSKSLRDELLLNANDYVLKSIPFLNENFSEKSLQKMVCLIKEINMTPNDVIYSETESNDENLYIIKDGKVELFIQNDQKNSSLNVLKKGEYFGEISFLTGIPRLTSVKSLSFSSLFVIRKEDFINIIKENNEDYERFCQIRDRISLYKDYGRICAKCIACKKENHLVVECPTLHLTLSHERIIEKYNFTFPQERSHYQRRKKKEKSNALYNIKIFQASAKKFLNELCQASPSESEESNLKSFKINSLEKIPQFEMQQEISAKKQANFDSDKLKNENFEINETDLISESLSSNKKGKQIYEEKSNELQQSADNCITKYVKDFERSISSVDDIKQEFIIKQENGLKEKPNFDMDAVKNYDFYFPEENIENLMEIINEEAVKKEKNMKSHYIFRSFKHGQPQKTDSILHLFKKPNVLSSNVKKYQIKLQKKQHQSKNSIKILKTKKRKISKNKGIFSKIRFLLGEMTTSLKKKFICLFQKCQIKYQEKTRF